MRPVRERRRQRRVLLLELGVDQLLLRVVDQIALQILEEAIAPLPDADTVDVARDVRAPDVHRDPLFSLARRNRLDQRYDPWIALFKNGHHVRRGHIAVRILVQPRRVERQILPNMFAQLVAEAVAVFHLPVRVVGRDRHNVRLDLQKRLKPRLPLPHRQIEILGQQRDRVVHILQIFFHRAAHLRDGLAACRLRVAEQRAAVRLYENHDRAHQHAHRHRRHRQHHDEIHAQAVLFHCAVSPYSAAVCRIRAGDRP